MAPSDKQLKEKGPCKFCESFRWIPPSQPSGYCEWCIAEVNPDGKCGCVPSNYLKAKTHQEAPDIKYENLKLLDELYQYACINPNGQGFASGVDEFREMKIKEYKSQRQSRGGW